MSELPPAFSDDKADHFWNRKRIRLAVLAIVLVVILAFAVWLSFGPTICCGVFPNIVNSL